MAEDRTPEPPADLRPRGRGRKFWRQVVADHELRPDEGELLAEMARMLDLADRLREAADAAPVVVDGRTNPVLVELRLLRQELRRGLSQLALPDPDAPEAPAVPPSSMRSHRARKAARARWDREP
jgi:hypothetical protein